MKQMTIKHSTAIAAVFLIAISCSKKENETTTDANSETVMALDSLVHSDSTNLSYDSATVKTAVGVKDEEQNAIKEEKKDAEKMKKDENHQK